MFCIEIGRPWDALQLDHWIGPIEFVQASILPFHVPFLRDEFNK